MSPEAFEKCLKTPGSRKVTKSLSDGKYIHGCRFPDGRWVWGEVKQKAGSKLRKILSEG